jgi:cation-dependent mannose-6-phosphate receptor
MAVIHVFRQRLIYVCLFFLIIILIISKDSNRSNDIINEISHLKDQNLNDLTSSLKNLPNKLGEGIEIEKEKEKEEHLDLDLIEPCTIINPLTNQFYDLRPLSSIGSDNEIQAWNSKGFDYGRNFSIGICSSPLKQLNALTDLDFIDISNKSQVGGYYTDKLGKKVSIGLYSSNLKFRGMNLILEYENGDKCENYPNLFKSTLLNFKCDREMMSKARVNYLGSMNNCSYFFEVKTIHACPTANEENDEAIWGIFLLILLSAIGVYFFAGIIYKIIKNHYDMKIKKDNELV